MFKFKEEVKKQIDWIKIHNGFAMAINLVIFLFLNFCLFISFITQNSGAERGFIIFGMISTGLLCFFNFKAIRRCIDIDYYLKRKD